MIKIVELISGKREIIRWANEAGTYGSLPATGLIPLTNARITPNFIQEWEPIRGTGTDEIILTYEAGVRDVKFTLTHNPRDWRLLVMAIGKATNTGSAPTVHTLGYKTAYDLESFSVQRIQNITSDKIQTYKGCKINATNISWNAAGAGTGKFVEVSYEIFAKEVKADETEKTVEASPATLGVFQSRNVVVTIGGVAYTRCLSGNIRISGKLSDGFYADAAATTTRSETEPQERVVTGSIVLHYDDDNFFDNWLAGTVIASTNSIEFRRTVTTDGATFTFTNFRLRSAPDATNLEGWNTVTLDFLADEVAIVVNDARTDYYTTA